MRIVVEKRGVSLVLSMQEKAKLLASGRWKTDAARGVADAGRMTKTRVQTAVAKQMAIKKKSFVTQNTRGKARMAAMAYDIFAIPGGQRVEEYKGLRALVPHGAVASRMNQGRSQSDKGTVSSAVWNNPRVFKRSFAANGGFFATLPKSAGTSSRAPRLLWTYGAKPGQPRQANGRFGKSGVKYGKIRRLFGPSLRDEIGEGEALATFHREGSRLLLEKVSARIQKILDK